jgi:hypothetical protein
MFSSPTLSRRWFREAFQGDSHTEEQLVKLLAEHYLTTPDDYLV